MSSRSRLRPALVVLGVVALVVSRIGAYDPTTWWLEIFPILLVLPVLWLSAARFRLSLRREKTS